MLLQEARLGSTHTVHFVPWSGCCHLFVLFFAACRAFKLPCYWLQRQYLHDSIYWPAGSLLALCRNSGDILPKNVANSAERTITAMLREAMKPSRSDVSLGHLADACVLEVLFFLGVRDVLRVRRASPRFRLLLDKSQNDYWLLRLRKDYGLHLKA